MKRMTLTTCTKAGIENKTVCFLSAYYKPGEGNVALVVEDDNCVHEVPASALSLPADEYNKIFAE